MPRMSAESRATGVWREGSVRIVPPQDMSKGARALWRTIVDSKPADWFSPGSAVLLWQYCELTIQQQQLVVMRDAMELNAETERQAIRLERRIHQYAGTLGGLANKLRLSVQAAVEWESRKIEEKGTSTKALFHSKPVKRAA